MALAWSTTCGHRGLTGSGGKEPPAKGKAESQGLALPRVRLSGFQGVWGQRLCGAEPPELGEPRSLESLTPWRASLLGEPRSLESLTLRCPWAGAPRSAPKLLQIRPIPFPCPPIPSPGMVGGGHRLRRAAPGGLDTSSALGRRLSSLVCQEAEGPGFVLARAEMALGGRRASTACQPRGEARRREKRATNA